MNIYITKANEDYLRRYSQDPSGKQLWTMSGLINQLLDEHRGADSLQVAKEVFQEELNKWPTSSPNVPAADVLAAFASPTKGSEIAVAASSFDTNDLPVHDATDMAFVADFPAFTPCKHGSNPATCKFAKFDKTRRQNWCK